MSGQPLTSTLGNPQPGDGTTMHYKFTGKERDSESGLDYFGARYYASNVGRWISADWAQKPEAVPYSKLDDPQSLNLYAYGGNNPITQADLDGHQSCNCSTTSAPSLHLGVTPSQANAVIGQIASFFKPIVDSLTGIRISGGPMGPIVTLKGEGSAEPAPEAAPAEAAPAEPTAPTSPEITPEELTGKTRSEIQDLAKDKGLVPKGDVNSQDHPRKWTDPVTNKERLRLDRGHVDPKTGKPYDNPNAARDQVHGYDTNGKPIEVNGDKHIPTN